MSEATPESRALVSGGEGIEFTPPPPGRLGRIARSGTRTNIPRGTKNPWGSRGHFQSDPWGSGGHFPSRGGLKRGNGLPASAARRRLIAAAHADELERLRADAPRERKELREVLDARAQALQQSRPGRTAACQVIAAQYAVASSGRAGSRLGPVCLSQLDVMPGGAGLAGKAHDGRDAEGSTSATSWLA